MNFLPIIFARNIAFKCPCEILIFRLDISMRCDGLFTASKRLIESLLVSVTIINVECILDLVEIPEAVEALAVG